MNRDLTILSINALVYLFTSIYWIRKKKWNVGILILLIMTISHMGAIFYYSVLDYLGLLVGDISIEPFVYLYICIFTCVYPFIKNDQIKQVDVKGNEHFIKWVSLFIIIITVEPFLENIKILMTQHREYSDIYEALREEDGSILEYIGFSKIGLLLNRWSTMFKIPATAFFFFYLSKMNKRMILGLGMVLLHYLLIGVSTSQRGIFMVMGLLYLSCFILMIHTYSKFAIKKILSRSLLFFIPFVVLFMAITISRYKSSTAPRTMAQWILLYVSEGSIKFNNEMYYEKHNTAGDVNLCFIKKMLGLKTYTDYAERDQYYLAKNGRRIEVFYTFVGDFVSDFGLVGAVCVCVLLSVTVSNLLHDRRGSVPIYKFMIILFLCHLYTIGFASNVYRSYHLQKGVFITLLLCGIMFINGNKSHKNNIV